MYKFKRGDLVKYPKGDGTTAYGEIVMGHIHPRGVGYIYKVHFPGLIPPSMDIEEKYLYEDDREESNLLAEFDRMVSEIDVDKEHHCPKCGKLWKITRMFANPWYDCADCGTKREDFWP